jgi:hypothetical protein
LEDDIREYVAKIGNSIYAAKGQLNWLDYGDSIVVQRGIREYLARIVPRCNLTTAEGMKEYQRWLAEEALHALAEAISEASNAGFDELAHAIIVCMRKVKLQKLGEYATTRMWPDMLHCSSAIGVPIGGMNSWLSEFRSQAAASCGWSEKALHLAHWELNQTYEGPANRFSSDIIRHAAKALLRAAIATSMQSEAECKLMLLERVPISSCLPKGKVATDYLGTIRSMYEQWAAGVRLDAHELMGRNYQEWTEDGEAMLFVATDLDRRIRINEVTPGCGFGPLRSVEISDTYGQIGPAGVWVSMWGWINFKMREIR